MSCDITLGLCLSCIGEKQSCKEKNKANAESGSGGEWRITGMQDCRVFMCPPSWEETAEKAMITSLRQFATSGTDKIEATSSGETQNPTLLAAKMTCVLQGMSQMKQLETQNIWTNLYPARRFLGGRRVRAGFQTKLLGSHPCKELYFLSNSETKH